MGRPSLNDRAVNLWMQIATPTGKKAQNQSSRHGPPSGGPDFQRPSNRAPATRVGVSKSLLGPLSVRFRSKSNSSCVHDQRSPRSCSSRCRFMLKILFWSNEKWRDEANRLVRRREPAGGHFIPSQMAAHDANSGSGPTSASTDLSRSTWSPVAATSCPSATCPA